MRGKKGKFMIVGDRSRTRSEMIIPSIFHQNLDGLSLLSGSKGTKNKEDGAKGQLTKDKDRNKD